MSPVCDGERVPAALLVSSNARAARIVSVDLYSPSHRGGESVTDEAVGLDLAASWHPVTRS